MQSHVINDLYSSSSDFQDGPFPVTKTVMIAAIPRSGSTFLCLKLWETGILGAPMEYLNFANRNSDMVPRLGHGDTVAYWNELLRLRTSPNGVFTYKMFIGDYQQALSQNPALLPLIRSDDTIYITRRDKLSQAVSYARAYQSGKWFSVGIESSPPAYSKEAIDHAFHWIEVAENGWEEAFRRRGCSPIRLYYEDLVADPAATIDSLITGLGISDTKKHPGIPLGQINVQRDSLSAEWRSRYLEDAKQDAA